jgi:ankyrin repeat protein
MTPLLWAAREGHMAVVRLLLQHGARVDHMDSDGHSALLEACAHGRAAVAMLLIHDYHADVTIKDWQRGLSPLMAACEEDGHPELVRSILRVCPSEARERDWGGRTALWWACFWGAPKDVIQLLLHQGRADYSTTDHHGRTPLDVATQGYEDCHLLITVRHHTRYHKI